MKNLLVSSIVMIVLVNQTWATLMSDNTRLDHAIYRKHAPKLIIAGTIDSIQRDASMMEPKVVLCFVVHDVVLGDETYKGQKLSIDASHFIWPNALVPLKEATHCILVLDRGLGEQHDRLHIAVVVPASGKPLPVAKDGEETKHILEGEILAELKNEKSPERQRALLLQVAPILTKEHSREVVPLLNSPNVWVMRAALSALVYATEKEQYIKKMASDVQTFFTANKSSDPMKDRWSVHPYHFIDHYFFLEQRSWTWGSRWNEEESNKHLRILNAMFDTGIISDEVKKKLNPGQDNAPKKIENGQSS